MKCLLDLLHGLSSLHLENPPVPVRPRLYYSTILLFYYFTILLFYYFTILLFYYFTILLFYYVLLFYYFTILLFYCFTIVLFYYFAILLFYYFTILLCYYFTILLFYYFTTLLFYYFTILLFYYFTILLFYYFTILLFYYFIILLFYYVTILLFCYFTILLFYYFTILLFYYFTNLLILREIGSLHLENPPVPVGPRNYRFPDFARNPEKFLPVSLLLIGFPPRPQQFASRKPTCAGPTQILLLYFVTILLILREIGSLHLENPPVPVGPRNYRFTDSREIQRKFLPLFTFDRISSTRSAVCISKTHPDFTISFCYFLREIGSLCISKTHLCRLDPEITAFLISGEI